MFSHFKKATPLLSFFLLINCICLMAQDNNPISKISISSPTAASLGKYGDIPVNYHTGIPQINIPIYTVSAGPLSLPISLSYHASGLKVQEPASWVGAGWSLNAGGVITRSVMGAPDERGTNNAATQTHGHFSDYGYNNYVNMKIVLIIKIGVHLQKELKMANPTCSFLILVAIAVSFILEMIEHLY